MKYKIGDEPKVKNNLVPDGKYDGIHFRSNMNKYLGKNIIIEEVYDDAYLSNECYWSDDMLEEPYFSLDLVRKIVKELLEEEKCIKCLNKEVKVDYVDFNTAKLHMRNGNKTKLKDCTYYIEDEELYFDLYSEPRTTNLSLSMIESNEWILL